MRPKLQKPEGKFRKRRCLYSSIWQSCWLDTRQLPSPPCPPQALSPLLGCLLSGRSSNPLTVVSQLFYFHGFYNKAGKFSLKTTLQDVALRFSKLCPLIITRDRHAEQIQMTLPANAKYSDHFKTFDRLTATSCHSDLLPPSFCAWVGAPRSEKAKSVTPEPNSLMWFVTASLPCWELALAVVTLIPVNTTPRCQHAARLYLFQIPQCQRKALESCISSRTFRTLAAELSQQW